MKTVSFKGTIESFLGKPVSPALEFEGSFQAFETIEELRNAGDYPKDDEILAFVNNQRKANERQQLMNTTLKNAGYERPTLENDSDLQVKNMVKSLVASKKYTETEAIAFARNALGLPPIQ